MKAPVFIILWMLTVFTSCYDGEEYYSNPVLYLEGAKFSDSLLELEAFKWDQFWTFEHTHGEELVYEVLLDKRTHHNQWLEGEEVDTAYSNDQIVYNLVTRDYGPDIYTHMRVDLYGVHDLKLDIGQFANRFFFTQDSFGSLFSERVVTYHDTVSLDGKQLLEVYEISYPGNKVRGGRISGIFYSRQRGVMGFYESRTTNYWLRKD